ncbi:hypothetical protein [uncultured Clostridium sp.]|uniref:hypothetical protein n=1 Tax=uncultured Clostridium sp. TaxID=59620 RepID=UPI0028EC6ABC|nr:hypothetical protein [uncultured Clostridium sp.]
MNNNDCKNESKTLDSWPVIIILTIVCFPVGLYLIYKKRNFNSGRDFARYIMTYFCFFMTVVGIIIMLNSPDNATESIPPTIFFFLIGLALRKRSKKLAFKAGKYEKYVFIIMDGKEFIIDNIAGAMSLPVYVVKKDLKDMINKGYFQGAYINDRTNEIVLSKQNKKNVNGTTPNYEPKIEAKAVTCKSCGAPNRVTTSVAECEYCGSPLSSDS